MSAPPRFRLGLVQMRCATDAEANLRTATAGIGEPAARGAGLVCRRDLFGPRYFCQAEDAAAFDLAEPVPGPTTDALGRLARELAIVVVGSVFERRAAGVHHNTAVVLDADGALRGLYRKMHIPDDPLYYEKYYFTPGDTGFPAFDTAVGRVAALVCWDQWYPEGARLAALAGANVLLYPTAIAWHPAEKAEHGEAQLAAWQTVRPAHAIATGAYVPAADPVRHKGGPGAGPRF